MVIWAVMLAAQTLPAGCTQAAGDEPVLCPARLPRIRSVVVERAGQERWREKVQQPDCRRFAPSAATMRTYFLRARRTDAQSLHYAMPESPCAASGRIGFRSGVTGRWRVDQFGVGHLTIGRRREMILYAPDLPAPFAG